eukprot:2232278-Rhodomonas_salina.2
MDVSKPFPNRGLNCVSPNFRRFGKRPANPLQSSASRYPPADRPLYPCDTECGLSNINLIR